MQYWMLNPLPEQSMTLSPLNALGIAGLVWCVLVFGMGILVGKPAKSHLLFAFIPALFTFLALL